MLNNIYVYFQSHRGGLNERPENTMAAYLYSWNFEGAIPEVDVRTTLDDEMVCIHDDSLKRTTNAPKNIAFRRISELTSAEIRKLDAGISFSDKYKGEPVPTLEEVFTELKKDKKRQIYLDVKSTNLSLLKDLIHKFQTEEQIIFVHEDVDQCKVLSSLYRNARCMTWFEGSEKMIIKNFQTASFSHFDGLKQLQIHLHASVKGQKICYHVNKNFLLAAVKETSLFNTDLMVRPFLFNEDSISYLLSLGIRWFAVDNPELFIKTLRTVTK